MVHDEGQAEEERVTKNQGKKEQEVGEEGMMALVRLSGQLFLFNSLKSETVTVSVVAVDIYNVSVHSLRFKNGNKAAVVTIPVLSFTSLLIRLIIKEE